jgi:hypothetical protein
MSDSPDPEASLEIIPNGRELVVAINLDPSTTFLLRDRTEQIIQLANNILDAECTWMPGELVKFAQDIMASRPTKVLPIEMDPRSLDVEIKTETELEQARKAREAMKEFSSFLRAVLNDGFARLEQQMRDWNEGRGPAPERVH